MIEPARQPHTPEGWPPSPTPAAGPVEFTLHPIVVWTWTAERLVMLAIVLVGAGIAAVAQRAWWALVLLPLPAAVLAATAILHARASVARFRAVLLPDGLLVVRGVWWQSETFVPRARVQHTDVRQGPLGRQLGIATLKVFTAGSHMSVIEVAGLRHESALALRDALLGRGERDGL
jgi:membrane protein YdbS with pleckstrin-like domain